MARARNIKPGFYTNEDLAECSIWARFIYPGLWMMADRNGLLEDRPKRIKAQLLPFDSQEVDPLLTELHNRQLIVRYRNDEGSFIWIPKFLDHQNPHQSEKASAITPPEGVDFPGKKARPEPEITGKRARAGASNPGAEPESTGLEGGGDPAESLLLNPGSGSVPTEGETGVGDRDPSRVRELAHVRAREAGARG